MCEFVRLTRCIIGGALVIVISLTCVQLEERTKWTTVKERVRKRAEERRVFTACHSLAARLVATIELQPRAAQCDYRRWLPTAVATSATSWGTSCAPGARTVGLLPGLGLPGTGQELR